LHDIKLTLQTGPRELFAEPGVSPVASRGFGMISAVVLPVITSPRFLALFLDVPLCLLIFFPVAEAEGGVERPTARIFSASLLALSQSGMRAKEFSAANTATLQA